MKQTILVIILSIITLSSCTHTLPDGKKTDKMPDIFPDYSEVTIPTNIAPLNFRLTTPYKEAYAVLASDDHSFIVEADKKQFTISIKDWKNLLLKAKGSNISVTIYAKENEWIIYSPFHLYVANESIDPYLAYRLIEPGYELWNRMGIYQRNLDNYDESAIYENKLTDNNCVNCHSFCMQNPDKMLFHMREKHPGTILIDGDKIEKLNTKTTETISPLVYPSWHPSGRFVAFSNNQTKQGFHLNNANRIEVYDEASDVVIYDIEKHEIITSEKLFSKDAFETFPTFSPDGKTLYFCTANSRPMPKEYTEVKYSLCSIAFNPETRTFGSIVDTLNNAEVEGKSASFPRVSPDGKHLLYTLSDYGNFSIWHKEADLHMVNIESGANYPLEKANSNDVESYHSWSSNSRWVVFSSRRLDGLYTRPYICYINNEGKSEKAFLLPQKDTQFYDRSMKSYNIPELIKGKVDSQSRKISLKAKTEEGKDIKFIK